jgi:hypothetical protein
MKAVSDHTILLNDPCILANKSSCKDRIIKEMTYMNTIPTTKQKKKGSQQVMEAS